MVKMAASQIIRLYILCERTVITIFFFIRWNVGQIKL